MNVLAVAVCLLIYGAIMTSMWWSTKEHLKEVDEDREHWKRLWRLEQDGQPVMGSAVVQVINNPGLSQHGAVLNLPHCQLCHTEMVLHFWDRPGGPPGNGFRCPTCHVLVEKTKRRTDGEG
jgi:hypothetical protein